MARHVVVVCGYGCQMTPELENYLDRVVAFCNARNPDAIIFSGGKTNEKTVPGRSEASVMSDYVMPRLTCQPPILPYLEDDAFTTIDNIKNVAEILEWEDLLSFESILTIFCEASKALVVDLLSRHFIKRRPAIETASWETVSPELQILATLHAWASITLPVLGPFLASSFRKSRIKRSADR